MSALYNILQTNLLLTHPITRAPYSCTVAMFTQTLLQISNPQEAYFAGSTIRHPEPSILFPPHNYNIHLLFQGTIETVKQCAEMAMRCAVHTLFGFAFTNASLESFSITHIDACAIQHYEIPSQTLPLRITIYSYTTERPITYTLNTNSWHIPVQNFMTMTSAGISVTVLGSAIPYQFYVCSFEDKLSPEAIMTLLHRKELFFTHTDKKTSSSAICHALQELTDGFVCPDAMLGDYLFPKHISQAALLPTFQAFCSKPHITPHKSTLLFNAFFHFPTHFQQLIQDTLHCSTTNLTETVSHSIMKIATLVSCKLHHGTLWQQYQLPDQGHVLIPVTELTDSTQQALTAPIDLDHKIAHAARIIEETLRLATRLYSPLFPIDSWLQERSTEHSTLLSAWIHALTRQKHLLSAISLNTFIALKDAVSALPNSSFIEILHPLMLLLDYLHHTPSLSLCNFPLQRIVTNDEYTTLSVWPRNHPLFHKITLLRTFRSESPTWILFPHQEYFALHEEILERYQIIAMHCPNDLVVTILPYLIKDLKKEPQHVIRFVQAYEVFSKHPIMIASILDVWSQYKEGIDQLIMHTRTSSISVTVAHLLSCAHPQTIGQTLNLINHIERDHPMYAFLLITSFLCKSWHHFSQEHSKKDLIECYFSLMKRISWGSFLEEAAKREIFITHIYHVTYLALQLSCVCAKKLPFSHLLTLARRSANVTCLDFFTAFKNDFAQFQDFVNDYLIYFSLAEHHQLILQLCCFTENPKNRPLTDDELLYLFGRTLHLCTPQIRCACWYSLSDANKRQMCRLILEQPIALQVPLLCSMFVTLAQAWEELSHYISPQHLERYKNQIGPR